MTEAEFRDWQSAPEEGRVEGVSGSTEQTSDDGDWTRSEWEAAAKRTHEMSTDEYEDWQSASF
jgi:hypothetical protein